MGIWDTAKDAVRDYTPAGWAYQAGDAVVKTFRHDPAKGSKDAARPGGPYTTPFAPNAGAYNPTQYDPYNQAMRDAGSMQRQAGDRQRQAEQTLMQGYRAPTPLQAGQTSTTPVRADRGMMTAQDALRNEQLGTANVDSQRERLKQAAMGVGPSAAEGMLLGAAGGMESAFQRAGVDSATAYRSAAANQEAQTRNAGLQAADQMRLGTEDAIRAQAALVSSARGGNIGLMGRNAQNNAMFQTVQSNRQAGQIQEAANRQASDQAYQAALQAGATEERARIEAARAYEQGVNNAATIRSQEQMQALGMLTGFEGQQRGLDQGAIAAATDVGRFGLSADQLQAQQEMANADRMQQAGQFSQQTGLAYDQLNSGNMNAVAGRAANQQQFGMQQMNALISQYMQMGMSYDQAQQAAFEAAAGRGVQLQTGATSADVATRGQNMQIVGAGLSAAGSAAAMSDKRGKKNIRKRGPTDFRKAGSYQYEYKDPGAPGAAPGKHSGPMAQELNKAFKVKGPDGLWRVDTARMTLALASAVGDLQRKLRKASAA